LGQSSVERYHVRAGVSLPGLKTEKKPFSDSLGAVSADAAGRPLQDQVNRRARQREQWEENAVVWEKQVAKDPVTIFYYHRLIFALKNLDRCEEIKLWTQRVLQIDPLDTYARWLAGACCYDHSHFETAVEYLEPSTWLNPSNFFAQRDLGYSLYYLHQYHRAAAVLKFAVDLRPNDFNVNYYEGVSLVFDRNYEAAIDPLNRAAELRPNDGLPFRWRGFAKARLGRYLEAIPDLEKALSLKKDDRSTRVLLFTAYLVVGELSKAIDLFPVAARAGAVGLVSIYLIVLIPLLWLSFRPSSREFPNVFLPIGWTLLMVEGQMAFLFFLGLWRWLRPLANPVGAVVLADAPILIGAMGFAKKRWGASFARPFRFGGRDVVLGAFGLLLGVLILDAIIGLFAGQDEPLQNTVPIFRMALMRSPIVSAFAIGVVVPAAEEVLFRGLLFGAFQRWLGPRLTIVITAFLFAAFHGQVRILFQLFIFGCVLGWARYRTNSIALPFSLHAVNNCLAMTTILSMRSS
jgi:membrane protease YdiL (CAAX protease family)/tetratricopeptide (TPR) repeat protein